jgi:hypothetical protein
MPSFPWLLTEEDEERRGDVERGNAGKVDDVNAVSDGNLWIIKHVTTDNIYPLSRQWGVIAVRWRTGNS